MNKRAVIDDFHGENFFLDNFYPHLIRYNMRNYPTSEHAFQAAKATNDADHDFVASAKDPGIAKMRGNDIEIRPDWEKVKDGIMLQILKAKFYNSPVLMQKLLDTGDAELIEGNTWNDTYWGVCRGKGKNKLGKLLMQIRDNVRGKIHTGKTKSKPFKVLP